MRIQHLCKLNANNPLSRRDRSSWDLVHYTFAFWRNTIVRPVRRLTLAQYFLRCGWRRRFQRRRQCEEVQRDQQRSSVSGSDCMNSRTDAIWLFSEMNSKSVALTESVRESCDAPTPACS